MIRCKSEKLPTSHILNASGYSMGETNSTISSNRFILEEGVDGIYSDITIELRVSEQTTVSRGPHIQLQDEDTLKAIEKEFKIRWIEGYKKDGINLEIVILNVGIGPTGRRYKVDNSVDGVMRDGLRRIGIQPPQIFGL